MNTCQKLLIIIKYSSIFILNNEGISKMAKTWSNENLSLKDLDYQPKDAEMNLLIVTKTMSY